MLKRFIGIGNGLRTPRACYNFDLHESILIFLTPTLCPCRTAIEQIKDLRGTTGIIIIFLKKLLKERGEEEEHKKKLDCTELNKEFTNSSSDTKEDYFYLENSHRQ